MKETIQSLIEQGNKFFLAGRQDAVLYFLDALKKSGALESVVKYARKYKDTLYENQQMLQKLLSNKYDLNFVSGALPFFLVNVKNQMKQIEADIQYERFKKLILSKNLKTIEQIVDVFIDESENPSIKEKEFFLKNIQ